MQKTIFDIDALPDDCILDIPPRDERFRLSAQADSAFGAAAEEMAEKAVRESHPEACALHDRFQAMRAAAATPDQQDQADEFWMKNGVTINGMLERKRKLKASCDKEAFRNAYAISRGSVTRIPRLGEVRRPSRELSDAARSRLFTPCGPIPGKRGTVIMIPGASASLSLLPAGWLQFDRAPEAGLSDAARRHFATFCLDRAFAKESDPWLERIAISAMIFALRALGLPGGPERECDQAIRWLLDRHAPNMEDPSLFFQAIDLKLSRLVENA